MTPNIWNINDNVYFREWRRRALGGQEGVREKPGWPTRRREVEKLTLRIDRPTNDNEITRFRLGTPDRPTRRAQRGEANFGSELPTDRPSIFTAS